MRLPLDGTRVLELGIMQQGPVAAALLGDLGAEVIKIEDPDGGDPGRGVMDILGSAMDGTSIHGLNYYFEAHNRNKKSVAVSLKNEPGRKVVYRLVKRCDVFLSNLRSSGLQKLGMDYNTLREHNPRLIYAHASAFGPRGPERNEPGLDSSGQARSGLMSLVTPAGSPPIDAGMGVLDQASGLMLALATVTALLLREQTGITQQVDVSLLSTAIWLQSMWIQSHLLSGSIPKKPSREKARNPFWNVYRCADDKWLALASPMSDEFWPAFCHELGLLDCLNDLRFATHAERLDHSQYLVSVFDQAFVRRPAAEWFQQLRKIGVMCDLVKSYDEVIKDLQVIENQYIVDFDHPVAGPIKEVGVPIDFFETPAGIHYGAPTLGQHTEEVLLDLGGYTWEDLVSLKEAGIII
jgi:crotonobetainyl-CoA:carnitine CoA-transferase CaiB-like acyl-CoA transferase